MADIINIGNEGFASARRSQYVDKSGLIGFVNRTLCSEDKFICVTRARRLSSPSFSSFAPRQSKQASLHSVCRRFGKSMAAKMLCAYYDQSCNSDSLFSDLQIASDPTYRTHLNKYPVIYLDMTFFTTNCKNQDTMVEWMDRWIKSDLQKIYPQVPSAESQPLISYLLALAEHQGKRFIMIIDEWDAICRETSHSSELMRRYVDWLRSMYSVLDPEPLQGYFGFTEEETKALCSQNGMDYRTMEQWYDGYEVGGMRIFNPNSVAKALKKRTYSNYWMQTGAYEGLKRYITMNLDGLRDAVVSLLAGISVKIESLRFSGDLIQMDGRDSVLTTLIHLGYLTYNRSTGTVRIPNNEVKKEFEDVIKDSNWTFVTEAIDHSERLMQDTLAGNEKEYSRSSQGAVKEYTLSRKQKKILEYCIQPRTLEEIAARMQVSDKYYLKRKHIDSMLGTRLLMTEPDSPTSPTQQYVTRED